MLNVFSESAKSEAPIRLSYHNGNHYNSVRDPYRATIGIGLGIAGLNPGSAEVIFISDRFEIFVTVSLNDLSLITFPLS